VLGYHGGLALTTTIVLVDDDPILRFSELMRTSRVGVERRIVPTSPVGVKNGKPSSPFGIEAARRDEPKTPCLRFFPVLPIHIQKLFDRSGLPPTMRSSGTEPESTGQRLGNVPQSSRAKAGNVRQPPIVSSRLQFLQRLDAQPLMKRPGEGRSDTSDGGEERLGIHLSPQALEHRKCSRLRNLHDAAADAFPYIGKSGDGFQPPHLHEIDNAVPQTTERLPGAPVRHNAERIRFLRREKIRHFVENFGDLFVGRLHCPDH